MVYTMVTPKLFFCSCDASSFDPLGIIPDASTLSSAFDNFVNLFSQTFESTSGTKKEKPTPSRGVAGWKI